MVRKPVPEELQAYADGLRDQEDIRKLQYTYGYYLDKCLYQQVSEPSF